MAHGDEVTAEDDLLGGGRGDLQGGRAFGEPFSMRGRTMHARDTATTAVGEVDTAEAVDADNLVGEAAYGGVAWLKERMAKGVV